MPEDTPELDELPVDALPEQEAHFRAPARFGNVPVATTPLGWDARRPGFRNHYPVVNLPTQIVDRVSLGAPELEPNRLIWGDNLHVMRQMPSESVDLIYIDPPFFSQRDYNVIWGDDNEKRSFSDIWEGGLDGYLIWLNARLYEMRRLLKPTGSIYVHCDWHASHYIKVEMDKILGYDNFRNAITWDKRGIGRKSRIGQFPRDSEVLLYYAFSEERVYYQQIFEENIPKVLKKNGTLGLPKGYSRDEVGRVFWTSPPGDYSDESIRRLRSEGRIHDTRTGNVRIKYFAGETDTHIIVPRIATDVWRDVPDTVRQAQPVGYPTEKPTRLIERVIRASSNEGDTVLDAFVGGGTTPVVAQRLGRRWIAVDQSRVAVAVTAERLKAAAAERGLEDAPIPDFTVEHWGVYEAERLAAMPSDQFRKFVLACYDARIPSGEVGIHGYKGARARVPVWVGSPGLTARVTAAEVNDFAQAVSDLDRYRSDEALRDGVMLAWGFAPDAVRVAEELREREALQLAFVRLEQVRVDSPSFRSHITAQSTERGDYSEFLTFVQPPDVEFGYRRLKPRHYEFDAGDTEVLNVGAKIVNVQWDFDYDGHTFRSARGEWFRRGKGKNPAPILDTQHTFPRTGRFTIACRVQDDKGGEGMRAVEVDVS